MQAHFEATGARWVFIITDANQSGAASYMSRYGVDFGWSTNDGDNTAGAGAVLMSGLVWSAPWVGALRASDMTLVGHDGQWGFDIYQVAQQLATE